jgi:hypothetical protein
MSEPCTGHERKHEPATTASKPPGLGFRRIPSHAHRHSTRTGDARVARRSKHIVFPRNLSLTIFRNKQLEELQTHGKGEAHVKPEPGLPAFPSIMSNFTGSRIPTVTTAITLLMEIKGDFNRVNN